VYNEHNTSLDNNDFAQPHEPGGTDHAGGALVRYTLTLVNGLQPAGLSRYRSETPGVASTVASHLAFDPVTAFVYFVDTKNGRVLALNPKAGTTEKLTTKQGDYTSAKTNNAPTYKEVAVGLNNPSGLTLGRRGEKRGLFVTDALVNTIHWIPLPKAWSTPVFRLGQSTIVAQLNANSPPMSLAGVRQREDYLYFVNRSTSQVMRARIP